MKDNLDGTTKYSMEITVYIKKDNQEIIPDIKEYFQTKYCFPKNNWRTWEHSSIQLTVMFNACLDDISDDFKKLMVKYPDADFKASLTYGERFDENTGLQWWDSFTLRTAEKDSKKVLTSYSESFWN